MELKVDLSKSRVDISQIKELRKKADEAMELLWSGKEELTGWVKLPLHYDIEELENIIHTADKIKDQCELFIVIGIGGSYLGAKAIIHALADKGIPGRPCVKFAGNNISATYHSELIEEMKLKDTCICIISKSGTTTEPLIAFSILKEELVKKYGKFEANRRIYAITDNKKGELRKEVEKEGYVSFVVPDDIGGRYSVLTPVGLLPMAVGGIDVRELLKGAEKMAKDPLWDYEAVDYAITRYCLLKKGKSIEIFEYYEPQLLYFTEWLKQLFGESEGKNNTGLFPASLQFTSDLHSMGQFLQEGSQVFLKQY